jgi:hypothetical protein
MNNETKLAAIGCLLGMSSCAMMDNNTGMNLNYPAYAAYEDSQVYMKNTYKMPNYNEKYSEFHQPIPQRSLNK